MWLHILVLGYYTKKEEGIPSLHWGELLKKFSNDCTIRAKGGGHGQNMTTQKDRAGRKCALTEFFFMTTHTIGKVHVQTFFFFAPLFEQSDVHFSTKWKTSPFEALFVGPKKRSPTNQINPCREEAVQVHHSTQKYFLKLAVAWEKLPIFRRFFSFVSLSLLVVCRITKRRPTWIDQKGIVETWWSRPNWICRPIGFTIRIDIPGSTFGWESEYFQQPWKVYYQSESLMMIVLRGWQNASLSDNPYFAFPLPLSTPIWMI